ncbi:ABC transporter ATP-binding protein [Desulfurococcus mucosus]|uniref:ABC transporter related protein n=1 Tax=Desulfurococcus mucosus (strain ATCC 35584 / DSM 2162 / JCM 9187 / O7/1) TaxID=765177 RepID=E8R981_DESM0|nr:ABC transporter ATP-binding protein [Desulfurococcus mucosus]ADV65057.1 ABC transporter related protein [Desulfurococcus mucosus DSM 2162]
MSAVEVVDVHKVYDDETYAVRGVSFTVRPGEIYGLIGPNGAGKTTLLRIIAGIVKPTRGTVKVYGRDPYREFEETRRLIGYLPEEANTYQRLTGLEHLLFYARLYGGDVESMVEYGARITGLGDRLHDEAGTYSHGMKRRLLLGAVLMRKPMLAILDEPTSGLDVHASVSVRRTIRQYVAETGSTVILSSHNMLEIEYLCDRVGLISKGRIVAEGEPRRLVEEFNASNLEEVFTMLVSEDEE